MTSNMFRLYYIGRYLATTIGHLADRFQILNRAALTSGDWARGAGGTGASAVTRLTGMGMRIEDVAGATQSFQERMTGDPMAMMYGARYGIRALPRPYGRMNEAENLVNALSTIRRISDAEEQLRVARALGLDGLLAYTRVSDTAWREYENAAKRMSQILNPEFSLQLNEWDAAKNRLSTSWDALTSSIGVKFTGLFEFLSKAIDEGSQSISGDQKIKGEKGLFTPVGYGSRYNPDSMRRDRARGEREKLAADQAADEQRLKNDPSFRSQYESRTAERRAQWAKTADKMAPALDDYQGYLRKEAERYREAEQSGYLDGKPFDTKRSEAVKRSASDRWSAVEEERRRQLPVGGRDAYAVKRESFPWETSRTPATPRAGGGAAQAGKPYRVNENWPGNEVFVPGANGWIFPSDGGASGMDTSHAGTPWIPREAKAGGPEVNAQFHRSAPEAFGLNETDAEKITAALDDVTEALAANTRALRPGLYGGGDRARGALGAGWQSRYIARALESGALRLGVLGLNS